MTHCDYPCLGGARVQSFTKPTTDSFSHLSSSFQKTYGIKVYIEDAAQGSVEEEKVFVGTNLVIKEDY